MAPCAHSELHEDSVINVLGCIIRYHGQWPLHISSFASLDATAGI